MAIQFKLSPKTNNLKNPPETKFYPRAVHRDELDFDAIADILSTNSTVTHADCYAVMIGMERVMTHALKEGAIVRLGNFGSFQVSIQGNGTDDPEELGKNLIKSAKVIYRPSQKIKTDLNNLVFERKRSKKK